MTLAVSTVFLSKPNSETTTQPYMLLKAKRKPKLTAFYPTVFVTYLLTLLPVELSNAVIG